MRGGAFAGVALATACGIFTAYSTFQPALQEQKEKRDGTFAEQHDKLQAEERPLSKAIADDLREARREAVNYDKGKFAWGIRRALFGSSEETPPSKPASNEQPEQKDAGR